MWNQESGSFLPHQQITNNKTTTTTTAAAASNFTLEILPDPVQPGEIRLHSLMLYTPQAPVLDLRGQNFYIGFKRCLPPVMFMPNRRQHTRRIMAEGNPKKPKSPNKQLSDSDTSDEGQINPVLKTSVEEGHYGTIPGSALATQIALSHSRAEANPTVERGPSCKIRVKKLPKERATDQCNQCKPRNKRNKLSDL